MKYRLLTVILLIHSIEQPLCQVVLQIDNRKNQCKCKWLEMHRNEKAGKRMGAMSCPANDMSKQ
jgi:hypothetical protein